MLNMLLVVFVNCEFFVNIYICIIVHICDVVYIGKLCGGFV